MSNRSQLMLDKYSDSDNLDVIFAQENGTVNKDKLQLSNIKTVHDTNNATNRGAVLYVHDSVMMTQSHVQPFLKYPRFLNK